MGLIKVSWLNERKNICILVNVITLQIILRNEIPGKTNLFNVTDTLIFVLKRTHYKSKVQH